MKIKSIKEVAKQETFDLNVKDNHNYFVGTSSIMVHNSGKDPTKVDRSAAYMARYIAKNVVAAGYANKATVQLSYAIGVAKPTSFRILTDNPNQDRVLTDYIASKVDLRPRAIIERLNLRRPIYLETARDGHFGFLQESVGGSIRTWENLDLSHELAL